MARVSDVLGKGRRLEPQLFVFYSHGRAPFDRVAGSLQFRQWQDSHRTLFKRSFEQNVDVPDP